MFDAKKAYSIVKYNNPDMRVFTCVETNKNYIFSLVPDNLKDDDGFANSIVYIISKGSGEYTQCHFSAVLDEPILREIDISIFD